MSSRTPLKDEELFLELCRAFKAEHGHLLVRSTVTFRGYGIGHRAHYWRQRRRLGKLPKDLIWVLDGLGFVWEPGAHDAEEVAARHEVLVGLVEDHYRQHGHHEIPQKASVDGFDLGGFVHVARQSSGRHLSDDLRRRLDEIGFFATTGRQSAWELHLAIVDRFVSQHGHGDIPREYVMDGVRIGQWLANQRKRATGINRDRLLAAGARMALTDDEWEQWWSRYEWDRSRDCPSCRAPGWTKRTSS